MHAVRPPYFYFLLFGSIFIRNDYWGDKEFCWRLLGKFLGSGPLAESAPGSHSLGVEAECREWGDWRYQVLSGSSGPQKHLPPLHDTLSNL